MPRMLAAFLGFAVILGTSFVSLHHWHAEKLENELFTPILERELGILLQDPQRATAGHWPGDSGIYGPGFDAAPQALTGLARGQHEIHDGANTYQVLVHDAPEGRYTLAYDQSRSETRERWLLLSSFFFTALAIFLATVFAILTYRHAVAPIRRLARQVSTLDAEPGGTALESRFGHSETRTIAAAIDAYQQRITDSMEREREFSANVSHELRTPLSIIQGAAELIRLDDYPEHKRKAALERIEHACTQMSQLVQALLVMARDQNTESSHSVDDCDVAEVAARIVHARLSMAREKGLELSLKPRKSIRVRADAALLQSVLGNVIDNALRYTEAGHVHIDIDGTGVTVTDSGSGIEEADMPYVFRRHYRGGPVNGTGSNGIGLSIVQRICDHYGWNLSANSHIGRGTTVRIDFASNDDPRPPVQRPGGASHFTFS